MAKVKCLTHFDKGNTESDNNIEYNCDGNISENDFSARAQKYGKFDIATESIGTINTDNFNPKTFTCILALDDGNKYRTNRKMMFSKKWKNVGLGFLVGRRNVYYTVAWMGGDSRCNNKKKEHILGQQKTMKYLGIKKVDFKKFSNKKYKK